jgi:hypothetical protein
MIRDMVSQGPDPGVPYVLHVCLPSHDVVWMGVDPLLPAVPFSSTIGSPCPSVPLSCVMLLGLPLYEFACCINNVDFIQKVSNFLFTLVTGVLVPNIQIPYYQWYAVSRTLCPCVTKIVYPRLASRPNVD